MSNMCPDVAQHLVFEQYSAAKVEHYKSTKVFNDPRQDRLRSHSSLMSRWLPGGRDLTQDHSAI